LEQRALAATTRALRKVQAVLHLRGLARLSKS